MSFSVLCVLRRVAVSPSAEDERVELAGLDDGRRINPKDAKGNVEVWLLQVEVRRHAHVFLLLTQCKPPTPVIPLLLSSTVFVCPPSKVTFFAPTTTAHPCPYSFWFPPPGYQGSMRRSVARSVDDAVRAYAKPDCVRAKWAPEHPGQAVLCVSQAYWTQDVERVRR